MWSRKRFLMRHWTIHHKLSKTNFQSVASIHVSVYSSNGKLKTVKGGLKINSWFPTSSQKDWESISVVLLWLRNPYCSQVRHAVNCCLMIGIGTFAHLFVIMASAHFWFFLADSKGRRDANDAIWINGQSIVWHHAIWLFKVFVKVLTQFLFHTWGLANRICRMDAGNCLTKKSMHQASLLCNLESFGLLNTENGETTDDKNRSANTGNNQIL